MIKNVIFDLGNVLLSFKPADFLLKFTDDLEMIKFFINKITRSRTWLEMDRGVRSVKSARFHFIENFPERKALLDFFFDNWMDIFVPIQENVQLLKDLNQNGYGVYYLSNFIIEAYEFVVKKFDFFSIFKGGIISALVKMIKPERQIYMTLMEKYQLEAETCLFIDDVVGFLRPARKMGFTAIQYTPDTDLITELKELGIKV